MKTKNSLSLKITEKGCVALYGLRRFPIVLYPHEWKRIFEVAPQIQTYLEMNKLKLLKE